MHTYNQYNRKIPSCNLKLVEPVIQYEWLVKLERVIIILYVLWHREEDNTTVLVGLPKTLSSSFYIPRLLIYRKYRRKMKLLKDISGV